MMQHPLITDQRGEGLIGFLVSVVISAIVFAATTTAYLQGIVRAQDHRTMVQVREEAREIADLIASELRLLGSGMPLSQDDFSSSDLSLGDAPLPLLLDSSASYIHFRLNEFGRGAIIDAAFDPISTSTISVTDGSIFAVGDTVYVTNMTTGGTDGLQGEIVSISGNSITLNGTMLYPVGATFDVGSLVEPVSTIAFNSPETWSGITRETRAAAKSR
ncbi:MAG: hypothetical protein QY326_08965 [Bdellovibrionota bacterium]|nr:MAG: hypothetical protein QY326_08965 [Bdellovibrionota bacterium]